MEVLAHAVYTKIAASSVSTVFFTKARLSVDVLQTIHYSHHYKKQVRQTPEEATEQLLRSCGSPRESHYWSRH